MIVAAAARVKATGEVVTGEPRKDRHDAVFFKHEAKLRPLSGKFEFGFVDDQGKYYNRKEAWHHAFKCGQVKDEKDEDLKCLISEDLW